ncbi:hypothetical protein TSUD_168110 [Trifolium subterraneum]|nr:hypothetical protein TSUD_168110 [Trifolium subterraneum]
MKNSVVLEGNRNYELQLTSKENLIEISDMLKQRIEEHKPGCDDQWLTVTPEIKKDVETLRREKIVGEPIFNTGNFYGCRSKAGVKKTRRAKGRKN